MDEERKKAIILMSGINKLRVQRDNERIKNEVKTEGLIASIDDLKATNSYLAARVEEQRQKILYLENKPTRDAEKGALLRGLFLSSSNNNNNKNNNKDDDDDDGDVNYDAGDNSFDVNIPSSRYGM